MDQTQTMSDYKTLAREARKKILKMVHEAGTSHIASNFSVVDIMTVLYENLEEGDEVVVSKGWAAASVYYFLAKQGRIPYEDLDKFGKEVDGKIPYLGLAETTVPGVLVNGGSVGHGLSVAVGMALGKKLKGESGRIYCVMSDGELNEGSTWEAAMLASHLQLDNLLATIDKNGWQAMGRTEDVIDMSPLKEKWKAFGWDTDEVDGHDHDEIESAIRFRDDVMKPVVIVANTVKGKGVSFMEDHLVFHYRHVSTEDLEKALTELNVTA